MQLQSAPFPTPVHTPHFQDRVHFLINNMTINNIDAKVWVGKCGESGLSLSSH